MEMSSILVGDELERGSERGVFGAQGGIGLVDFVNRRAGDDVAGCVVIFCRLAVDNFNCAQQTDADPAKIAVAAFGGIVALQARAAGEFEGEYFWIHKVLPFVCAGRSQRRFHILLPIA